MLSALSWAVVGVLVGVLGGVVLALIPTVLLGPGLGLLFGVGTAVAVAVLLIVRGVRGTKRALFFSIAAGMFLGVLASPMAAFLIISY